MPEKLRWPGMFLLAAAVALGAPRFHHETVGSNSGDPPRPIPEGWHPLAGG